MSDTQLTILTAASDAYWPVLALTAANKLEYCLSHGFQLIVRRLGDQGIPPWGERQLITLQALKTCDWLMFMGADTLIMNHEIDARSLLRSDKDFIIGNDVNGINNDVFFLRNCPAAVDFMRTLIQRRREFPNDQAAMIDYTSRPSGLRPAYVHQRQFNSYLYSLYNYPDDGGGTYQDGDFVLHLPGLYNDDRIRIIREYLPMVRRKAWQPAQIAGTVTEAQQGTEAE